MTKNPGHLKLLSLFHFVIAVVVAIVATLLALYCALVMTNLFLPHRPFTGEERVTRWIFTLASGSAALLGGALAVAMVEAGRSLRRLRNHGYCLFVAAVSSVLIPFGTILSVWTIIALTRPAVKELFGVTPLDQFHGSFDSHRG